MKLAAAVGCVRVREGGQERSRGTGFLVGEGLLLTALHVVMSRQAAQPLGSEITADFPALGLRDVPLALVPGARSAADDWALLRCPKLPGANPLPLGELPPGEAEAAGRWQAFGYPDASPDEGLAVAGELRAAVPFEGGQALQLYCLEAAAGDGAPVPGLSGAPLVVDGACVGLLRASLLKGQPGDLRNVAGTLYATPIAAVCAAAQELLPVPDPYRGLPGLPLRPLPERPFRSLEFFRPEDAEIFFGRGPELRALYELVTSEDAPHVVLLYGQSGVGKSSLLSAGLFPRLRGTHAVRLAARDPRTGLLATLRALLGARPGEALPAAWARAVAEAGQPLLVLLDQVEEHVTRPCPGLAPGEELAALCAALAELSASSAAGAAAGTRASAPAGRVVLGFRKEYLAELEQALGNAGVPRGRLFLDRMGRPGVVEVIEGLTRSERLRRRYGLSVEPGLAGRIADDLLADEDSPVTTILQVLLTELWAAAAAQSPASPRFTAALYDRVREGGLLFQDFLRRQLQAVARAQPQAVESGLALDLLGFHTTPLGTAAERGEAELLAAYPGAPLQALLGELKRGYLLADPRAEGAGRGSRLAHDTLGPLVQRELRESARPGQAARRILEARLAPGAGAEALDDADLLVVERGLPAMRAPSEAERRLIDASRRARARRRWLRRGLVGVAAGATLLVAGLGASALLANRKLRERQAELARQSAAGAFRAAATAAEHRDDPLRALLHATEALTRAPAEDDRLPVYIAHALHLAERAPRRIAHLGLEVQEASFSADLRRAAVLGVDGDLYLYELSAEPSRRLLLSGVGTRLPGSLRLSPDGRRVALLDADRVRLVEVEGGAVTASPPFERGVLLELRFTSAGRPALLSWLAGAQVFTAAGRWCGQGAEWARGRLDAGSGLLLAADEEACGAGEPLRTSRGAAVAGVARSADGARTALLVRGDRGAWIELQDRNGARVAERVLSGVGRGVRLLDLSPDGGALLLDFGAEGGATPLRIVRSGGAIAPVPRRFDAVPQPLLASDGRGGLGVITLGTDLIGLWRDRWQEQAVLTPPQDLVATAVSADRRTLRALDRYGVLSEWAAVAPGCDDAVGEAGAGLQAARFSPDGDVVVTARQDPPAAPAPAPPAPTGSRGRQVPGTPAAPTPAPPAPPAGPALLGLRDSQTGQLRWEEPLPGRTTLLRVGPHGERVAGGDCPAPAPGQGGAGCALWLRERGGPARRLATAAAPWDPDLGLPAEGPPRLAYVSQRTAVVETLSAAGPAARCEVPGEAHELRALADGAQYVLRRGDRIGLGELAGCKPPALLPAVGPVPLAALVALSRARLHGELGGDPGGAAALAGAGAARGAAAARPDEGWLLAALGGAGRRRDFTEQVTALHPALAWTVIERRGALSVRELRDATPLCVALAAAPLDAAFAPDGHHLLVAQKDGRLLRQRVSFPERDRPPWLLELGPMLVGYYQTEDGRLLPVPGYAARRAAFVARLRQAAAQDSRARFVLRHIEEPAP